MSRVAMLWNDTNPGMMLRAGQAQEAAAKLGVTVQSVGVHDLIDFEPAYAAIRSGGAEEWNLRHNNACLTLLALLFVGRDPFAGAPRPAQVWPVLSRTSGEAVRLLPRCRADRGQHIKKASGCP
jgi:hypothetical protein